MVMKLLLAASTALFSEETPIPIKAEPWLDIIVLTSAKSKFTSPDTAIKSEIP